MAFADSFWEIKNIIDYLTLVGLVVTLFSIYFTWYLARQDLKQKIEDAQSETVDRLARILLQSEVIEALRCACVRRGKRVDLNDGREHSTDANRWSIVYLLSIRSPVWTRKTVKA